MVRGFGGYFWVSLDQYKEVMDYFFNLYPEQEEYWNKEYASKYQWIDGIPKSDVFVKLNPDITDNEREIVANGLRALMKGKLGEVVTTKQVENSVHSVHMIFTVFVAIIALISMVIAFFLLLISMSQNINSAIWEYGVLRSMGLTKSEGQRIYIYEAFIVVSSASILGITIAISSDFRGRNNDIEL